MKNWTDFLVRGNLVDFDGVVATVVELRVNNCRIRYKRRDTSEEHTSLVEYYRLKPLVLNEERLINWCGFVRHNHFEDIYNIYGKMALQSNGTDSLFRLANNEYPVILEFIHELQNIYASLERESLPINMEADGIKF